MASLLLGNAAQRRKKSNQCLPLLGTPEWSGEQCDLPDSERGKKRHRGCTHDHGARNHHMPIQVCTNWMEPASRLFNGNMHVLQFWRARSVKLDKDAKCLWADHYLASLSGTSGHFRPMWEGLFFFINDLSRPCKQCMAGGSQRSPRRLLVPHINLLTSARSLRSSLVPGRVRHRVMCYCLRRFTSLRLIAQRCRLLI